MAFSGAEKQARYRARLRLKRPLPSPPPDPAPAPAPAPEAFLPAEVVNFMEALQAAYVKAAQTEAKRFLDKAYKNGDFGRVDAVDAANCFATFAEWVPAPPGENMIKAIVEEAGARAGWQHQADTLLVWFAKHRAANERQNDLSDKSPKIRARRQTASSKRSWPIR